MSSKGNNGKSNFTHGTNPYQEYPGQPYYDENGVLHYPDVQSSNQSMDPYSEEYQRQLEEYNRILGNKQGGEDSLRFHSMNEAYSQNYSQNQGQYGYPQNTGTSQRKGQNRSGGTRNKYAPENLQFGSNSPKSKNSKNKPKEQMRSVKNDHANYSKKKHHPVRAFFKTVILLILVLFILANLLLLRYIGMVNVKENGTRTVTNASMNSSAVTNILVIGSDTRDSEQNGRTDSMILLSINRNTKEITMTSFMRDMYVEIVGKNSNGESVDFWDKMNAAYVYGGAELLMDTIEYNFDIAIDDYVYIDFYSFVDIVDAIGGIEIKISDEEAKGMTDPMGEQNKILGNEQGTDYLSEGGNILMNGNQALAYARLRYVGNADFERTERQRTVIAKIIEKVKSSNPLVINKFAKATCSNLTTNMSKADMLLSVYKAIFSLNYEIKSLRIPHDNYYTYGTHDGQSTLDVDFDRCKALLKQEIYGE